MLYLQWCLKIAQLDIVENPELLYICILLCFNLWKGILAFPGTSSLFSYVGKNFEKCRPVVFFVFFFKEEVI